MLTRRHHFDAVCNTGVDLSPPLGYEGRFIVSSATYEARGYVHARLVTLSLLLYGDSEGNMLENDQAELMKETWLREDRHHGKRWAEVIM